MTNIPDKWKINCPLDHSTFEKFINCDCNYGNARDVWWFKEQQVEKLQAENKIMREVLEFYATGKTSDDTSPKEYNIMGRKYVMLELGARAREALEKVNL